MSYNTSKTPGTSACTIHDDFSQRTAYKIKGGVENLDSHRNFVNYFPRKPGKFSLIVWKFISPNIAFSFSEEATLTVIASVDVTGRRITTSSLVELS